VRREEEVGSCSFVGGCWGKVQGSGEAVTSFREINFSGGEGEQLLFAGKEKGKKKGFPFSKRKLGWFSLVRLRKEGGYLKKAIYFFQGGQLRFGNETGERR